MRDKGIKKKHALKTETLHLWTYFLKEAISVTNLSSSSTWRNVQNINLFTFYSMFFRVINPHSVITFTKITNKMKAAQLCPINRPNKQRRDSKVGLLPGFTLSWSP